MNLRAAPLRLTFAFLSLGLGACGLGSNIGDYAGGQPAPNAPATGGATGASGAGAGGASGHAGGVAGSGGTTTGGAAGSAGKSGGGTGGSSGSGGKAGSSGTGGASGHAGTGGGGAAGGTGGSGGSGGSSIMGSMLGKPCSTPDAYACNGNAQQIVVQCKNGVWTSLYACSGSKLCDSTLAPNVADRCADPDPLCSGHAPSSSFCSGSDRVTCGPDLVSSSVEHCTSAKLCALGMGPSCATCVPGTFNCNGATLQKCSDDATTWMDVTTCATAAECNAGAGQCTTSTCVPNQHHCNGDILQVCNAAMSGFDNVMTCGPGLCDEQKGTCDACLAGSAQCTSTTMRQVCASDGSAWMTFSCGTGTTCTGAGTCVGCTTASDCGPSGSPCLVPACVGGTCDTTPVAASTAINPQTSGTDCKTDVCDGKGGITTIPNTGETPPSDGNPCHGAVCDANGNATYPNLPSGTSCNGSGVCDGNGNCCQPTTCAAQGMNCGTLDPGCGQPAVDCGTCASGTCMSGVCGCTPTTSCSAQGFDCGTIDIGCNMQQTCGSNGGGCPGGYTCTNNVCTCVPASCASLGASCGTVSDGCGGTLDCGGCTSPNSCGGGGVPNACGCTPLAKLDACANAGADCGSVPNGCGGTVYCGGCTVGESCLANICEPTCCFTASTPITMADGSTKPIADVHVGDVVLSIDPATHELSASRVTLVRQHTPEEDVNGTIVLNGSLETTPEHPFLTSNGWKTAGELAAGDELFLVGSGGDLHARKTPLTKIERRSTHIRTWTLEVDGFRTFFAGGIAVRIKNPC